MSYDATLVAGTWYLWKTARRRLLVSCPSCSGLVLFELDDLDDDGTLCQEFVCHRMGCSFRDQIRLEGWSREGPPG